MTNTKDIDPCALATLTTGTMLVGDISKVYEAAEQLLGHPVWTHEFIHPDIKQALIDAVQRQFPEIPTEIVGGWEAVRDTIYARYGETVPVERGNRERVEGSPVDTLEAVAEHARARRSSPKS